MKAAFILWNSKVYKDLEEVKTSTNEWILVQENWNKMQAIRLRIVCITVVTSVTNLNWNTIHIEVGGYDSIRISEKADVVAAGTNLHHFCLGCRKYKDDICEILWNCILLPHLTCVMECGGQASLYCSFSLSNVRLALFVEVIIVTKLLLCMIFPSISNKFESKMWTFYVLIVC